MAAALLTDAEGPGGTAVDAEGPGAGINVVDAEGDGAVPVDAEGAGIGEVDAEGEGAPAISGFASCAQPMRAARSFDGSGVMSWLPAIGSARPRATIFIALSRGIGAEAKLFASAARSARSSCGGTESTLRYSSASNIST